MNLLLTFALSIALSAPAGPIATVEPDSGSVAFTTASVWLRVSPAFDTTGIALLPRGAQVRIVECRMQTCKVEFRQLRGYVLRELLRSTQVPNPVDPGRGYFNSRGQWIPSPTQTINGEAPNGATARCRDGSYSFSQSARGTCSWHGGVAEWLSRSSGNSGPIPHDSRADIALLMAEHRLSLQIHLLEDSAVPFGELTGR
ncbi:MAG TPA: DUF3761 domain-containing protein [Gemmatimonadales bacterium]|nr:DUF3761 domain-containing protein [Gemmatimonadales bacterium]